MGDAGLSVSRHEISTPEELARWLDEVLTVLAPERRVSLMGISYGGWLAAHYALRHPGWLRDLVQLAPAGVVLPLSLAFIVRVTLLSLPVPGLRGGPLRRTLHWLSPDAARGDDACRARVEQAIQDVQMAVRHFALPPPKWPTAFDDEAWHGLDVPCLFLVGENERIYSARAAFRRLRRVAAQVEVEIIPGAGHGLVLTQPDLLARRVLAFLERDSAPSPSPRFAER